MGGPPCRYSTPARKWLVSGDQIGVAVGVGVGFGSRSALAPLPLEVLERLSGCSATNPSLELGLVAELMLAFAGVKESVLRDVLCARSGTEGTT
jgi:hypothetical protein